jgi:hypothetical protein
LKSRTILAAALAVLVLASCQPPWRYFIVNHTGAPIEIVSSKFEYVDAHGKTHINDWGRWEPWPMVIRNNTSREVQTGGGEVWRLLIRANDCLLTFVLPQGDGWQLRGEAGIRWGGRGSALQLEADSRLYVVPPESDPPTPSALTDVIELQPAMFPASPTQRRCQN